MYEVFMDALMDTVKMVPLLLVIFIGIELVEYKFGNKIILMIQKAGVAGPAVGALAGSLPQCGISVVTTALYTQRLATIGTLLAVYLSTSDEAIPIIFRTYLFSAVYGGLGWTDTQLCGFSRHNRAVSQGRNNLWFVNSRFMCKRRVRNTGFIQGRKRKKRNFQSLGAPFRNKHTGWISHSIHLQTMTRP
jgi:hypothetical protein